MANIYMEADDTLNTLILVAYVYNHYVYEVKHKVVSYFTFQNMRKILKYNYFLMKNN
jgi:hypothetical protein